MSLPTISNVVGEHTPLVVGNTEKFKVTSNYEGQVQYKALLFNGTVWSELSMAYGAAVDAKTPFVLPQTKQFKAGKYRLSVWVKRAGTVGVKTNASGFGSYDNYSVVDLVCVNNVSYPTINNVVGEHTPLVAGDTENFKVTSNYEVKYNTKHYFLMVRYGVNYQQHTVQQ